MAIGPALKTSWTYFPRCSSLASGGGEAVLGFSRLLDILGVSGIVLGILLLIILSGMGIELCAFLNLVSFLKAWYRVPSFLASSSHSTRVRDPSLIPL